MRGTFYVTLDIGKRLIAEKKRASFLSILITWVWSGSAFVVPSAMSKTAINAMTQSLATEWDAIRAMIKGTNAKDKADRTTG